MSKLIENPEVTELLNLIEVLCYEQGEGVYSDGGDYNTHQARIMIARQKIMGITRTYSTKMEELRELLEDMGHQLWGVDNEFRNIAVWVGIIKQKINDAGETWYVSDEFASIEASIAIIKDKLRCVDRNFGATHRIFTKE